MELRLKSTTMHRSFDALVGSTSQNAAFRLYNVLFDLFQTVNRTYFDNLTKLNNFVLVKFLNDSMILPKESEVNVVGDTWSNV